jgi:hypothetical protein
MKSKKAIVCLKYLINFISDQNFNSLYNIRMSDFYDNNFVYSSRVDSHITFG